MAKYAALRNDASFVMPHLNCEEVAEVLRWLDGNRGHAYAVDGFSELTGIASSDLPRISTGTIKEVLGWANAQRLYM